ncbi:MAG: hypothetical protein GY861_04955, partial [bacterium]|nr:hypothetical protein [bacterium]
MSKQDRELWELFWIQALVTGFPFGLNDKIKGYGIISQGLDPMQHKLHPYFCLKMPPRPSGHTHGIRHRRITKPNLIKVNSILDQFMQHNCTAQDVYFATCNLSKVNLKVLYDCINSGQVQLEPQIKLALLACMAKKFQSNLKFKPPIPKLLVSATFPNKGMEYLNLQSILASPRAKHLLPFDLKALGAVMLCYKFEPTIGAKFMSYNKVLKWLDSSNLKSAMLSSCTCASLPFNYVPLGHVVTGDRRIIQDELLRNLFDNGTHFREPRNLDWSHVTASACLAVDYFIALLQRKTKLSLGSFSPYKIRVLWLIEKRLTYCKIKFPSPGNNCNKLPYGSLQELRQLQDKYVITCADKASNNFIFTCKLCYLKAMADELGVTLSNG